MELEVTLVFVAVSLLNVFLLTGTVLWYRRMHDAFDYVKTAMERKIKSPNGRWKVPFCRVGQLFQQSTVHVDHDNDKGA